VGDKDNMVGRKRRTDSENSNKSSLVETQQTNSSTGSKENNVPPETETDKVEFQNKINTILDEFELEFQAKLRDLQELAESHAVTLQNCLAVQLVKIPKRIREMPLFQFRHQYQEDVSNYLMTEIKTGINRQLRSGVKKRKTKNETERCMNDNDHKKGKPPLPPTTATKPSIPVAVDHSQETENLDIWASTPASAVMRRRRKIVADIVTTETEKINEETKKRLATPKSIQTKGKKNLQNNQGKTKDSEHKSISKLLQEMRASHTTPASRATTHRTTTNSYYSSLDVPLHIQLQSGDKIDLSTPQTLHKISGSSKEEAKLKLSMLQERIMECLKELDDNE